ncbi:A-kinase anchor protein 9 isoform X2 [Mastacembelus armatus]|uniref:A-kinase anchor protein 9 isoform X2 n=1 Tax=Mastacembelus armatus TaxID=205130 RepID=UPI000E45B2BA|nr:A-kinase anchor protein 9 isoform X2 [Mastacembelus armatus]
MEDEERQKKLEAGKAKLAEYRQRKAHADSQKKQKKKKKKKTSEDSEGDSQGRVEAEPDQSAGAGEVSGGGQDASQEGNKAPPTTEFTFASTLRSGETVKHDQTYTIEPESEVSTTAEDYSSEVNGFLDEMTENLMMSSKDFIWEEVELLQQGREGGMMQDMEDALTAKTQPVEELNPELEEVRAAFGPDGIQQLQDFEAALKQRDGIITQLTANLQQAREEKDEIMKEFLELTEQSQKLQIQFQQLQAGEALRNTSHSSTAADLLQARQQLIHYQQQLEEMNVEVRKHQERNSEQLEHVSQLQHKLSEMEMSGRRSEESHTQSINDKDLLITEQEKVIAEFGVAKESFAQTLKEKNQLIADQTAIITEHERSLTLLREELAHVGKITDENIIHQSDEKDLIIAEQERVISERDCSLTQLEDELESSEKQLRDLQQRMATKEAEIERCLDDLENTKSDLERCISEMDSCKLDLEKERVELEICKGELATSRQKERMSSNEIMQLMGTVEDLQKCCHQGSLSESDTIQKVKEESMRKLDLLRAELDEMYGQQIVQMKQEINLQHVVKVEQMTKQHCAELEHLKAQQLSQSAAVSTAEKDSLNAKIRELQETLKQSKAMHDKTSYELSQVSQEKLNLQSRFEELLKEKTELVSRNLTSQESQQGELHRLQETIENLKSELAAAHEAAQEAETKHESEITNYKIKLEMLEREKDAVLDRMAESQEAELERLRTQLLFSHEEELTHLREELQRESFLNTENLLNEAAIKHERMLDELRIGYEEELHLLQKEKARFSTERDELLHQILGLKEDLKLALHSSKADELVQQLQELQLELEELRKGGEERVKMENEIQTLLKKTEVLENQTKEKEQYWENKWKEQESEKKTLIESNDNLKAELRSNIMKIEALTAENNQIQQEVAELREETEKQRTTFSFAEKNFEVNYQELKEEYTCLVEAKSQLEERRLKQTLDFEAKIASLQSQIRELEESSRDIKMEDPKTDGTTIIEKDTTELMEKLHVTLSEKESLAGRLSVVTEQLLLAESKVGQREEELMKLRQENAKVIAQNESLGKELERKQEIMREQMRGQGAQRKAKLQKEEQVAEAVSSFEDHHLQIQSLQEEIKALQSILQAAEAERDSMRQTLELQRLSLTPSPAAILSSGEGPERSSPQKSTASGSSRRKRRQRSKQERRLCASLSDSREERPREEEEEGVTEEERATSAAEQEMQAQMESQVVLCSEERAGKEDSTDGHQGDRGRDYNNKQVTRHETDGHTEPVMCQRTEEEGETTEHGECRLQMEAQRISLSQIHAAQLELLQEDTVTHTQSLELKLHNQKDRGDLDEPKILKYQNMLQVVSEECSEIILSFQKTFGKEFLESLTEGRPVPTVDFSFRPETSESTSVLLEARELYRNLQQVRERIEQEHHRLSQCQTLLRADGNKMMELQKAYDELKSSSVKEISDLHIQIASLSPSTSKVEHTESPPCWSGTEEHATATYSSLAKELQSLKAEAQRKQLQLEESHRQDMEHLRAHYQQQATETEERYATELYLLQQRLQEFTGTQSRDSLSSDVESSSGGMEEHSGKLKDSDEEELSEGGVELHWPARSTGLTAQLQALRKALYHKYVQEVAALKEQHSGELRRLREEREQERQKEQHQEQRGEREQDLNSINAAGSFTESLGAARQVVLEGKQHQERVEEEVAKAIVQMSVEFAQQSEVARINKLACQTSTSMQTRLEVEKRENEEQTPRASLSTGAWLEEVEKERLERELEERNAEIIRLKEELQKTETASEQPLKTEKDSEEEEDHKDEDAGGPGLKQAGRRKLSLQDDGESLDKDTERNLLREANQRLRQVLVDVLKTTAAAEETMGLHMQSLRDASGGEQQAAMPHSTTQRASTQSVKPYPAGHSTEICQGSETSKDDVNVWSREAEADKGLEVAQQMMDNLLLGAGTQLENEEYVLGISSRLQTALKKMLMAITDTTNQLEHAQMTQTELMRESFHHSREITNLLQKQEELQERLSEEAQAREQLALELHRAESLIDGYTGERAALEEQLHQKEELQLSLEQELQVTSSRLHELEQERLQMQEERELLSRQQDAMREHAGPRELRLVEAAMVAAPEADLLEETEKLMKEKVEVQRQAEKENTDLLKQVKLLEVELEEQVNKVIELEHTQKTESGDLRQQIQALEKQLEKNRRFLDEQAVDREHERDFFQQEIQKLEQQLKNPQKLLSSAEQRNQEVDQLTSQLKEKADWCSELLLSTEQLRRELGERDEEIDKLESRIRELEQALLASAESLEKVEQKKQHASITEATHSTLEAQLQTEREALERKEKEIRNLEEQLEQFREDLENKSEEVQQLHMQLEIQKKEINTQQQYLETRDSLLQVMEEKDREIALLNEQITKLQHMETASDNKEIDERDEMIKDLESQVECLRSEQERLKRNNEEELDQLNAVIDKLQQELANIEQKQAAEEDEDTKGGLESGVWAPSKEEYDEIKQKMDLATIEFNTLKTEHRKLLDTYLILKESTQASAERQKLELEEALREKTAGVLVMQAQVQALEQSAMSRVEELELRIKELRDLVCEKDCEISRCRLLVEQTQSHADGLQQEVSTLEENLRAKVAAALVSQATLEAVQQQSQRSRENQDLQGHADPHVKPNVEPHDYDFGDFGIPKINFSALDQVRPVPMKKVVHLTQKLRELEVGLSGMQKDQELQKQLLSSSEEEVLEYERRLAVLMDLLSQMKAQTHERTSSTVEASSADYQPAVSELLQELQEVRDEASDTKEQLNNYKESCSRLQEDLREKTVTIERLQDQLQKVSHSGSEEVKLAQLLGELMQAQNEASTTKEELSSCKESLEKLQELLQEREMTIAHLKGELCQVKAEEDRTDMTELLQELQEVRNAAASTKEELSSCRQHNEKLQEDLKVREVSISKLKEELQEVINIEDTTKEELSRYRLHNEKLQHELHVRELSISKLKEELQEVRTALTKTADCGPPSISPSPSPSPSPQPQSIPSSSSTTQPKRKGGKQPTGKGSNAKDKSSVSRKNSATSSQSSNRSHSSRLNSSSEQQHVAVTDSFTQTEPLQLSDLSPEAKSATKEEMEEVIGEFQEKIVQMQELHAAEILDMEARHISESENLRRDTQALEDECKALKAIIDKLRCTEGSTSRQDRPLPQLKDGYTSDSSSDYSQRTGYELPSLQQEFRTTPEGARRETDDPLPDRIKTLLREVHQEGMQVLSLSELPLSASEPGSQFSVQGWVKERDALLATVESLKGLITQMQTRRETQTPGSVDWRGELLDAVQQVFLRERSVLKNALYNQLDLLDTSDAIIHFNQLERRLAELDAHHREAMGLLHTAERASLISEIHQLRGQLEQLHQGGQPTMSLAGECSMKEQREEEGGADGAAEADRLLLEELKGELSQTKLELETTLKAQHKHLKELDTLRAEVSQKAAEVDALNDQLMEERKRCRDLQWVTEKEKCRTGRTEERNREELEDLHLTLEEQKNRVGELTSALDQERQASSKLSQQAEQERLSLHSRLQELQVQLETERAKAQEMSTALGRERELRTGASSNHSRSTEERVENRRGLEQEESLLERLQRELDEKHAQVVHLLTQVEAQKLEVVRKEEELTLANQRSRRDKEELQEVQAQLESLEAQMSEAQEQLERELQRRRSLEEEKERLEERLNQTGEPGEERKESGSLQADGHSAAWPGESTDRTKDWVFQQKHGHLPSARSLMSSHQVSPMAHTSGPHHGPWRTVDRIVGQLQLISSKVCSMANKNTGRLTAEVDSEELSWVQSSIDEVITMLQESPGLPSIPESASLLTGGSSSSLTERLLRQNAELTGFVSRLTEEKNDLRNHTLRLEEELRRYRQAGLGSGDRSTSRRGVLTADSADMLLSQEREAWTREKVRLEKALRLAQAQVAQLRGEIRSDTMREISGPGADNAALKRMYGKYLRSESFRKALIYQKKYLLLLLGGFQECEEATLSLLSRMGGRPSPSSLESLSQRRRGLMRFRSAVRVSIALSRMRFLVKRWHKATGMTSTASCSGNKNGVGQTSGTEMRDSPYLHPGSVDMYRERGSGGGGGVSSNRGRSGRESPRSAHSSTQQRFHLAGDHGPLTCSHLQSYDPDRALTDYISRLEALQRRLGSVTSGASSYAQLHFGLRR